MAAPPGAFSKLLGTLAAFFQHGGDAGPGINANGAALETRNATNAAFAVHRGATPIAANDLVTKAYADAILLAYTTVTASGTAVVPANVTAMLLEGYAGGGGGGGGGAAAATSASGGGGGAGALQSHQLVPTTPGDTLTFTIGAGGAGGTGAVVGGAAATAGAGSTPSKVVNGSAVQIAIFPAASGGMQGAGIGSTAFGGAATRNTTANNSYVDTGTVASICPAPAQGGGSNLTLGAQRGNANPAFAGIGGVPGSTSGGLAPGGGGAGHGPGGPGSNGGNGSVTAAGTAGAGTSFGGTNTGAGAGGGGSIVAASGTGGAGGTGDSGIIRYAYVT